MKKLLLFFLLIPPAFGQRYDNFASTVASASGIGNLMQAIPNATITVCNFPGTGGTPCTNKATTYTNQTLLTACALGTQVVLQGSSTCQATGDTLGNFGFWAPPGKYQYCVSATNFTTQCYNAIVPVDATAATILNTVLYVGAGITTWAGSDIGAQINSAYAALPSDGGRIRVVRNSDGSCYTVTTPIVFQTVGKFVILEGAGVASVTGTSTDGNACLNYTPTSGAAITLDVAPTTGGRAPGAGLRDISIVNNNCLTAGGCGGTAIGLVLGGTNGGVLSGQFQNVQFRGFNAGVSINDSLSVGWGLNFVNDVFVDNATGVKYTVAIHENDVFRDSKFTSNNIGLDLGTGSNVEVSIANNSFDGNLTNGAKVSTGSLHVISGHWENPTCPNTNDLYINQTGAGVVDIVGGWMLEDCTTGTATQLIVANGFMTIDGLQVFSGGRTITNLITNTSGIVKVGYVTTSPASISGTCSVPTACMWLEIQTPVTSMALKFGNTTSIGRDSVTLPSTSFTGITNATGLQIFNTTTTCTTAATISTPCTTAAITLPVAYADTNYRIVCNGLPTVTAFPQIQTITKSNTTFTITVNNLTAAAASYGSFDCLVGHN